LNFRSRKQRALIAMAGIGAVLLFLGTTFFRTQVLRNNDFALRAEDNRIRVVPIPPPRGAIYDRNGELIAETVTDYSLRLLPASLESTREQLSILREPLGLTEAQADSIVAVVERRPGQEIILSRSLSFERVAWIEEHRLDLPTVSVERFPRRHYPEGEAVAHLVGYVGEINRDELADSINWPGYRAGDLVGRAGIERQYERILGGQAGERYVEVDARGRIVGSIAPRATTNSISGGDLRLSIDLSLQRFIHSIFPKNLNGAVVAIVPSTGEVLALYSFPTFDPNRLTGSIPADFWRELNSDARRPLLNRATSGIYAPGSTWKLATAIAGLEKGVIQANSRMPAACSGGWSYAGRYARCWNAAGHGSLDLAGAISNSCNVYFYQLGVLLGLNQLAQEGTRLGFSRKTGIDFPTEATGTFPADADWYLERFRGAPTPSEVLSLAIGQGPNAQTPIRMAQFFAALAGNGTAPAPRLIASTGNQEHTPETDLGVRPSTLVSLRRGLAQVMEPGGTAYMSSLQHWKVYGKSGTAQNSQNLDKPHAWFTGFAGPEDGEPEIAFAVIVEFGESGSAMAAPIATKVADYYLNSKYGRPTPLLQTLRERSTGVPMTDNTE
jgi:penicillin-binding protein 2